MGERACPRDERGRERLRSERARERESEREREIYLTDLLKVL